MSVVTEDPTAQPQRSATDPSGAEASPSGRGPARRFRSDGLRMPHGLTSGRFAAAVGGLLAAGLICLLAVNTSLAAGAIEISGKESELARATEAQQALAVEVEALASPLRVQQAAAALGMVPATAPAFLDPTTGVVSGALAPAVPRPQPATVAPQVTPPTPEPTPTPSPSVDPAAPVPIPTAPPVADPGVDGAVVIRPDGEPDLTQPPTPAPAPALAPAPAPAPAPTPAGDSATVTGGR